MTIQENAMDVAGVVTDVAIQIMEGQEALGSLTPESVVNITAKQRDRLLWLADAIDGHLKAAYKFANQMIAVLEKVQA